MFLYALILRGEENSFIGEIHKPAGSILMCCLPKATKISESAYIFQYNFSRSRGEQIAANRDLSDADGEPVTDTGV
ncbi:hypothetical protein CYPRO_1547 [Cyclonatronum proteinivorum]|uniref:Uncharacterized protein n=1 Tax=Cyclonatronum proteinivorum TaxID=1457365 RepID=A0A345UJZ6_9BACT|nr:hypothetical protein CYPRO_1547 [Cyclonatronum proteinivorum]